MSSRGKVDLTLEDVIATLKRTNLPTVVCEGKDDIIVLRRLEDLYADRFLSVISVGGRDKVLSAFDNRHLLPEGTKFVFIADLDLWVFGNVPPVYMDNRLLFSDGYSIENDVIRDGDLRALMSGAERVRFERELDMVCSWFACGAHDNINGGSAILKTHPNAVLSDQQLVQASILRATTDGALAARRDAIRTNPDKLLRGKTLLPLMMRHLSYDGRPARHRQEALLDSVGAKPGDILGTLFAQVGQLT